MRIAVLCVVLLLLIPVLAFGDDYCFEAAAHKYGVPASWLWAIAKVESDFDPHAHNSNKGGSEDRGVMQINSCWKKVIGEAGWARLDDVCYNIHVGAWILADCIGRYGYTARALGCYNAVSEKQRIKYASKVVRVLQEIEHGKYQ